MANITGSTLFFQYWRDWRFRPTEGSQGIPQALLATVPPAFPPINQDDWFNMYRQPWLPKTDPLQSYVIYGYPAPVPPFSQTDWFTVWRPRWIAAEPVPQNITLSGITSPVPVSVQTDWFTVFRPRWIQAEPVPQNPLLQGIPRPPPNQQTDWFAPFQARWVPAEPVPQNPLLVTGIPSPVPVVFGLTDWPRTYPKPWTSIEGQPPPNTVLGGILSPSLQIGAAYTASATLPARWIPFEIPPNFAIRQTVFIPFAQNDWSRAPTKPWVAGIDNLDNILAPGIPVTVGEFKPALFNTVFRPRFVNDFTAELNNAVPAEVSASSIGIYPAQFGSVYPRSMDRDFLDVITNSLALNAPPVINNIGQFFPANFISAGKYRPIGMPDPLINDLVLTTPPAGLPFGPFDYQQCAYFQFRSDTFFPDNTATLYTIQPKPFHQQDWFYSQRTRWVEKGNEDFPNLILNAQFAAPFSYDDGWPIAWRASWSQQIDYPNNAPNLFLSHPIPFVQNDWPYAWGYRSAHQAAAQSVNLPDLFTPPVRPFGLFDYPTLPTWRSAQQAPVILNPIIYGIPSPVPPFYSYPDFTPNLKFRFVPSIDTIYPYNFLASIGYIGGGPGHAIIELPRRRRPYTTRNQRKKRREELDLWAQGKGPPPGGWTS